MYNLAEPYLLFKFKNNQNKIYSYIHYFYIVCVFLVYFLNILHIHNCWFFFILSIVYFFIMHHSLHLITRNHKNHLFQYIQFYSNEDEINLQEFALNYFPYKLFLIMLRFIYFILLLIPLILVYYNNLHYFLIYSFHAFRSSLYII